MQSNVSSTVVQIDMDGNPLLYANVAGFSNNKEEAKLLLGSVEKINEKEVLIADSKNKRVIIYDVVEQRIKWQYDSDRYVLDAHLIPINDTVIDVGNSSANDDLIINQNQVVIWENTTDIPTTIYSGYCADFEKNFDVKFYGDQFQSELLSRNERYAFKFTTTGEFYWFSYPVIVSSKISVYDIKVSSENKFIILESDSLESPYSSRIVKVDNWGNVEVAFGKEYLVSPKDARPLINNRIIIGT